MDLVMANHGKLWQKWAIISKSYVMKISLAVLALLLIIWLATQENGNNGQKIQKQQQNFSFLKRVILLFYPSTPSTQINMMM